MASVTSFAPATIANLACGFDILGLALDGLGDSITIRKNDGLGIIIENIEGDGGRLSKDPENNTAGVAILEVCKALGITPHFTLSLKKGLPLGSGLGSSAASSVAALVAINEILGSPFSREELLPFAMQCEKAACGTAHADNVAPALLGGVVLIRSCNPLDVIKLPFPEELHCVVVTPDIEVRTEDSRNVLKMQIKLSDAVVQWGNIAGLVAGLSTKNLPLIGRSLSDNLIEPERAILIPGFYKVKEAAIQNGALGCSISGSGPSVFALLAGSGPIDAISEGMKKAFSDIGLSSTSHTSTINTEGARIVT